MTPDPPAGTDVRGYAFYALVMIVTLVVGALNTRAGRKDTTKAQEAKDEIDRDRDAFGRMREMLEQERLSGEHWRELYMREQDANDELRKDNVTLTRIVYGKAIAAAAGDGVTAADLPELPKL